MKKTRKKNLSEKRMMKDEYTVKTYADSRKDELNKKKLRRARRQTVAWMVGAFLMLAGAVYFMFFYNWKAYLRQHTEEDIADVYISYLIENAERLDLEQDRRGEIESETVLTQETHSNQQEENTEPEASSAVPHTAEVDGDGIIKMGYDFADTNYYERNGVTYTPDYASGYLMCVLEFPAVGIRRGVYTGTWDDIYADLDMWMVTAAHPGMRVGETHLAIYGHNHTSQNLSFNNLRNAQIGDRFFLYADSGVYTYEVTGVFSEWRETVTRRYVDDFSVGNNICYLITCGRDEHRYKDLIVEGHIVEYQSLTEYAEKRLEEEREWSNE